MMKRLVIVVFIFALLSSLGLRHAFDAGKRQAFYSADAAYAQGEKGDAEGDSIAVGGDTGTAGNATDGASAGGGDNAPEPPDEWGKADPEQGKYTRRGYVRLYIPNGRITGNTTDKLYHIEGGIEIYYYDIILKSDTADIDQNAETTTLSGNVYVEDPEYRITCDKLFVKYQENWLRAEGFVEFDRYNEGKAEVPTDATKRVKMTTVFKNKITKIYCSSLDYSWDSEDFKASGEVKVVQDALTVEAADMSYAKAAGTYTLAGDVVMVFSNFDWLFNYGIVEKEDEKVAHAMTKSAVTIKCDNMTVNDDAGIMECKTGEAEDAPQVSIDQADKKLECDTFSLNDTEKMSNAAGNVKYWQKDGNWLIEAGLIKKEEAEGELLPKLDNPMTLTADTMSFDYDKRKMESESSGDKPIRIDGKEGEYAECKKFTFDDKEKLLEMSGGVTIISGKEYLYCDKLFADTNDKIYKFIGDVDGFVKYQKRGEKDIEPAPEETQAAQGEQGQSPPAQPAT